MSDFGQKKEEFYFWEEMWNGKTEENENKKDVTKDGVEDPSMGLGD